MSDDQRNTGERMNYGRDTYGEIFFYEHDYYVLSNFSAFRLRWRNLDFDTSEQAYHWEKFPDAPGVRLQILRARSAHEAFQISRQGASAVRPDWLDVRVDVMREILRSKAEQHEYVRRKLHASGERRLVEDSWRDDFWGWGPDRDGRNMLGVLWMEIRAELRSGSLPSWTCPRCRSRFPGGSDSAVAARDLGRSSCLACASVD